MADVLSARASLETAAINLSYTTILTPIGGRIGKAAFTVGNLVGPTIGSLATVVQVDPIRVVFSVADGDLVGALTKSGDTQAQLNASVALHLELSNDQAYAEAGSVEFIDNQVDPSTGTVAVWGVFANPQGLLLPGAFATVSVRAAKPLSLPTVPVQSVQDDAAGEFVLLVDKDGTVRQQKVTLGSQIGQNWVVTAGLTGGENVIVQGFQKVAAGQHVTIVQQSSLAKADTTSVPGP
jgi:membrane fusion protein (multidrug efflux system)